MSMFIIILLLILIFIGIFISKQIEDRKKLPDDPNYVEPIVEDDTNVDIKDNQ